jgi:short-subunit dehydrogenase/acyl carrier protein
VGLIIAEALVTQGAKHLVLASRNQPAVAAQEAFERLRKRGAQIEVMRADIGQREQVVHLLKTIERTMPPLRGVIHAAGVLDDATLLSLDWQRFERVLMPKALGAWHLHQLTKHLPLDLFVCFSSAMSLLGSPGQGNYCAANAFLDTLAHERRRLGLPALSINWGAWAQVGLAAAQANRGERLAERGLLSFSPEQGRAAWERLLQQQKPQLAYMVFDAHQWQLFYPHTRHWTLLAKLAASEMKREQGNTPSLREHLLETKGEERVATLETYVAGVVLKIVSGKQTKIRHDIPLARLGLDSLMALEMRTTMTRDLQCQIPLKEMLGSSSIQQIAQRLHQLLASGEEENKGEREPPKMGKMVMVSGSGERRETSGHGF